MDRSVIDLLANARAGDKTAQYKIGNILWEEKKYKDAVHWLQSAAEQGVASAISDLARINFFEQYPGAIKERALYWYEKLAEAPYEDINALAYLGILYCEGNGTKRDTEKGMEYIKRYMRADTEDLKNLTELDSVIFGLAQHGDKLDPAVCALLGRLFYMGHHNADMEQSSMGIAISIEFFRIAADNGDNDAKELLEHAEAHFALKQDLEKKRIEFALGNHSSAADKDPLSIPSGHEPQQDDDKHACRMAPRTHENDRLPSGIAFAIRRACLRFIHFHSKNNILRAEISADAEPIRAPKKEVKWKLVIGLLASAIICLSILTVFLLVQHSDTPQLVVTKTLIEPDSYAGNKKITHVTISEGVTSIGARAFDGCSEIIEISLPESMVMIGEMAFRDCTGLTEIYISKSVRFMGEDVFWGCPDIVIYSDVGSYAYTYAVNNGLQVVDSGSTMNTDDQLTDSEIEPSISDNPLSETPNDAFDPQEMDTEETSTIVGYVEVFPPRYDRVDYYRNCDLVPVWNDNEVSAVDRDGNEVVPFGKYDDIFTKDDYYDGAPALDTHLAWVMLGDWKMNGLLTKRATRLCHVYMEVW